MIMGRSSPVSSNLRLAQSKSCFSCSSQSLAFFGLFMVVSPVCGIPGTGPGKCTAGTRCICRRSVWECETRPEGPHELALLPVEVLVDTPDIVHEVHVVGVQQALQVERCDVRMHHGHIALDPRQRAAADLVGYQL